MNKLDFIKSYIERCEEVIASNNYTVAEELQNEIIGVFGSEIPDIYNMLDNYSTLGFDDSNENVNFIGDIKLIKKKLENYYFNIQENIEKMKNDLKLARLKQPQVLAHAESNPVQTATVNVTITIEQTIFKVDSIPEEKLLSADKGSLKEMLYSLDGIKNSKNKSKYWDKAKEVLKFIADKGIDVAIAVLPYVLTGLNFLG
jgi:hypothetical protein